MASEQTVGLRLNLDASDLKKELAASGKAADELAGDMQGMGGKIERLMAGIVDSAGNVEQGIRGVDQRLDGLTGADREVFLSANIGQAQQAVRQLEQMLTDPTLTDAEISIVLDKRNEATRQIDKLKAELGELGPAAAEAGEDIERGLNLGALGGAAAGLGVSSRLDEAVTSAGRLRAQLGLTADEAREFDAVAKQVYRDNFGESMSEATQVVGQVHQALGLVGADLERATVGVFSIRDAFDHLGAETDLTLNAVRTLKANFPDKSEAEILDLIAGGFQVGAGRAGDFLDVLNEYPGDFARIGLSAEDMVGIVNEGLDAGVWNADRMGDAVREMGIRVTTAGDLGQDAIRGMFPADEADRLIRDFGRGGTAGREAFFTIMDALTQVEDPAERFNLSVELMGSLGEELANQFPGMRDGLLAIRDGAHEAGSGVDGLASQYSGFRNTVDGFLRSLETSALGTLGDVGIGFADVGANVGIAALGLKALSDLLPGTSTGLRGVGGALRGIGAAGAAVGVLYGIGEALDATRYALDRADLNGLQRDLLDIGEGAGVAGEAADIFGDDFGKLAAAVERVADPSVATQIQHVGNELTTLGGLLGRGKAGPDQARQTIDDLDKALAALATVDAPAARQALEQLREELGDETYASLLPLLDDYDSALAGIDVAGRTAAGGVDVAERSIGPFGDTARDAAIKADELEAAITGVIDALHRQFDPFFAATDAMLANEEAQRAVEEAHWAVTAASDELAAAIAREGEESWAATDARHRLEEAERNLTGAQRDAGRSAIEVTSSMSRLRMEVENGTLRLEDGVEQLDAWEQQGLITKGQAEQLKLEMFYATLQAQELGRQNPTVILGMDASQYWAERSRIAQDMFDLTGAVNVGGGIQVKEVGGWIEGGYGKPVPIIAHGREFVINADAAARLGPEALHALNRGEMLPATYAAPVASSGGGVSIDYDRLAGAVARLGGPQVVVNRGDQIDENTVASLLARKLAR